ncbi:hypothetical protein GIB67_004446 [Kingdonia uniflora]|uniref:Uncharacterized protein n=1 Tax=Kingdonia uniflora TaxID=39325 RepID=A0A7J7MS39_9MAGN|nr:hypothetical protein GIB67_004446 [Kingdonia uniflora]
MTRGGTKMGMPKLLYLHLQHKVPEMRNCEIATPAPPRQGRGRRNGGIATPAPPKQGRGRGNGGTAHASSNQGIGRGRSRSTHIDSSQRRRDLELHMLHQLQLKWLQIIKGIVKFEGLEGLVPSHSANAQPSLHADETAIQFFVDQLQDWPNHSTFRMVGLYETVEV